MTTAPPPLNHACEPSVVDLGVEVAVAAVWKNSPGAGVKQLVNELAPLFPQLAKDGTGFKRRVKTAKQAHARTSPPAGPAEPQATSGVRVTVG
jgi:hypothetical protein